MQDNVQQELLLAFTSHGLAAREVGQSIVVADSGLRVESLVTNQPSPAGGHMVCVEVATYSRRLGATPIVEGFAGFGSTQREAVGMAFGKFLLGTFHILIESLSDHVCEEQQASLLDWQGAPAHWRVYCGPVLSQSEPEGSAIAEQCARFLEALEPLFLKTAGAGSHWLRVFVGAFKGQVQTLEVLLDNERWVDAETFGRSWKWVTPRTYASARVFAVAMASGSHAP